MRGYWGHNQLGVFVLNHAPRSRMKEGTRRVNWNSAMRRMMLPRFAGAKRGMLKRERRRKPMEEKG